MSAATARTVHAACPHDCPDTCALRVTVEDGRVVRIQGDPGPPGDTRRAVHQGHPLRRAQLSPRAAAASAEARRPQGPRRICRVVVGRSAGRHRCAPGKPSPRATRRPSCPTATPARWGWCRARRMAARFFHRLGASRLDRTICSMAGGDALIATYGAKVGMHMRLFAESRLIVIWGSNSIASNLHFWTLAQQAKRDGASWCASTRGAPRRPTNATSTSRCCSGHRRCARARRDARVDRRATGSTTTTSNAMSTASRACASARCMAARARRGGVRHHGRRSPWPGPRPGHHPAGRDPAELRHAARAAAAAVPRA